MASVEQFWRRKDLLLREWLQVWNKKAVSAILQGTVQGGRRRGRHKKRWESNISECGGLTFLQRPKRSWKQNQMEGEGCYVRGAPTVTISACVRAKLSLGWLFQFRSIYLTILFCTVCDSLKISGHFLEQLSIKPGNSSLFYKLKALRHEEQTWEQIFLRLEIPWILANGLSSTEQYLSVSDLFCENARSTDFEEKMGGLWTSY